MSKTIVQTQDIEAIINAMTLEEMCGQVMNFSCSPKSFEEFKKIVPKVCPGGIFVSNVDGEWIAEVTKYINQNVRIPVIVSADIENGIGCCLKNMPVVPEPMAWGACDDEELVEQMGIITGELCRKNGIHWNFAPIVDINYNKDNSVTNTRAISDSPKQVAKIAGAYVRGMQKNGMMIAGSKHFPGDGVDDRNQHYCTTINSFTKEKWLETYGYVYKKMFEAGTASVMVGHIACPAFEDEIDPVMGPKPGTLSHNIMTKLLRQTLGYEGCIVSDAMSMIGACAMCPPDQLAIEFFNAGGDMLLFALERDYDCVLEAVKSGIIPVDRLKDAVRHVLEMKKRARLFEDQKQLGQSVGSSGNIEEVSMKIAEKSIKIIRNTQDLLPLKLKKGARFLMINFQEVGEKKLVAPFIQELDTVARELESRGYEVDSVMACDVDHNWVNQVKDGYDCILLNCRVSSRDYLGCTLRINRDNIMPLWRGAALDHPCVVFTSFGDPYKLYEFPYLKTYVNAFSSQKDTQKAFVKVLLGEITPKAKNPVGLIGFFDREVE